MYFQLTTTGAVEASIQTLRRFIKKYQDTHPGIAFEFHDLDWNVAWNELVRIAIAKTGAHLSEVGSPWLSDFVAMNALRRFSPGEVDAVGGAKAFFPAPWRNVVISPSSLMQGASASTPSAPGVYALPGRVDVRLIYYWKDMLEKAGVDEAAAFSTPEQIELTLEMLRASGVVNPWIYETHATRNWVYNMASWIWAYGGEIMDEFGLPSFDQPEAIEGITAYFRLQRFLAPMESGESVEQVFSERRAAAMVMATHYHVHLVHDEDPYGSRDMLYQLGAARLPGPAFVGGTCFVVWQHTPPAATRTAVDLLTRLLTSPYLAEFCYETHMMPSRVDGLEQPRVAADPFLAVLRASLEGGRSNPTGRLWMPIADRLSAACKAISTELQQNPGQDVRALVERHVQALAKRMRMGLGGR
jgi:ABC-type glycerol-3-phosphate transport system substrate-binding protein